MLLAGCSPKIISGKGGGISDSTFKYLRIVYYDDQLSEYKDESEKKWKIVQDIRDIYARKILAEKKGLLKDIYYPEYLIKQIRARRARSALHIYKTRHGPQLKKEELFEKEGVKFSPEYAAREIENLRSSGKSMDHIRLAVKNDSEITLGHIKKICNNNEWQQLIAQNGVGLQNSLREFLEHYLFEKEDNALIDKMGAVESEIEVLDIGRVAVLYLQLKYGMAGKGIYPGMMFDVKFTPTELYDHFHKIQRSLSHLISAQLQYTVVADEKKAEEFLQLLDNGKDFYQLTGKFAVKPQFIHTGKFHQLKGYDRSLPVAKRERRNYYDKLFIDMASRDMTEPEPYKGKDGFIIARLKNIMKAQDKVSFEESGWRVKHDLQVKLLGEQFKQDMKDTIENANLEIRLPPFEGNPSPIAPSNKKKQVEPEKHNHHNH